MNDDLHKQAAVALQCALDAGAGDAIAVAGTSETTDFGYRDGQLEQVERSVSHGLTMQLYVDGRYSTHHTCDLREDQVRRFITDAVALTRHLAVDPARVIPDPALYANRAQVELDLTDAAVLALERDTCLDWLREMDEITHGDARVISATSSVSFGGHQSARLSSNGFEGYQSSTMMGCGSEVTLDEGDGRRPEAYRFVRARHLEDLPPVAEVAAEALERARRRVGSHKASSARTFMVVDPEAGGQLVGRLGEPLSAGAIQQNCSCLAGKLNQRIASPLLSLTDDPLRPRGPASRLFDREGISSRPMAIVEEGVLKTYYVDTYYGRKLDWKPTTANPSNISFALGDRCLDELVADLSAGFYITGWAGGNADMTTGDFSYGIRGHCIEGGHIGAAVSEMNITGNYLQLLEQLVAVGNDPTPYSSLGTPTLVFENVEFSGA